MIWPFVTLLPFFLGGGVFSSFGSSTSSMLHWISFVALIEFLYFCFIFYFFYKLTFWNPGLELGDFIKDTVFAAIFPDLLLLCALIKPMCPLTVPLVHSTILEAPNLISKATVFDDKLISTFAGPSVWNIVILDLHYGFSLHRMRAMV